MPRWREGIRGTRIPTMGRHSTQMCEKFQAALDLLAKRWTGQIIQSLLQGPLRFSGLSARLEVVGDKMLSERLKELEEHGVVERRVIARPVVRVEYALTRKGRGLGRVFGAMSRWADRWLPDVPAPRKAARGG
jgi:DNA-binding HxlR family transcriptional regulator